MYRKLNHLVTRSALALLVVGALAACDNSPTGPSQSDVALFDGDADSRSGRTGATGTTGRPVATPARRVPVDTLRPCRPDERPELTQEQIEQIRALWAAYNEAVAPLLRYIETVEKEAREAKANGASDERVAEILAKADEARREVAKLTQRLRDAINEVLSEGQRRDHCLVTVPVNG